MKLSPDVKRVLVVLVLAGLMPAAFIMVNSNTYFKAGIIYIVFSIIAASFYVLSLKVKL